MLFGLCRLMQWSHCIFCVLNRLGFFLHPWHLRSSASTLASARWRKLCDGLRRWCCSDTYQARYAQTAALLSCKVFVMLQMKTRPHLFTTLSMRLPSSIGGDIQCIHQCLHLDLQPLVMYEGKGFYGERMWHAIWHTFYDITLCLYISLQCPEFRISVIWFLRPHSSLS